MGAFFVLNFVLASLSAYHLALLLGLGMVPAIIC